MQVREVGPRCSTGSLRPWTRWMNLAINVLDDRTPTYGEKTVPILARFGPQSQYLSAIYARTTRQPELKLIWVTGNRTVIDPMAFNEYHCRLIWCCGSICWVCPIVHSTGKKIGVFAKRRSVVANRKYIFSQVLPASLMHPGCPQSSPSRGGALITAEADRPLI